MIVNRMCPICGAGYFSDPLRPSAARATCSASCGRALGWRKQSERASPRQCPACGCNHQKPRSEFCSQVCRNWAIRHPGEMRVSERHCATCGVDISHMLYKAKVCSKRCSDVARGMARAEPLPDQNCVVCGASFRPWAVTAKYCSEECRARRPRVRPPKKKRPYSDIDRNRDHRKRARKRRAKTGAPVLRDEIAARDRYRCGICRRKVNMALAWPDPLSPSLDHVEPLSLGGAHDPANVRLAHLKCNTDRSNRGGNEQLMLVG